MAAAEQLQGLKDEVTCSVCLDYFSKPMLLDCGHNFCASCVDQYLHQADGGFTCPQCRTKCEQKTLRENRQLANVVKIVKQLREPTVLPPPVKAMCPEHDEKLKMFCAEDQRAICVVCSVSQQHKQHSVVPIKEAFWEYKIELQLQLQAMKKKLKDILEFQSNEKKKAKDMESETKSQTFRQRIEFEFEELHQYLKEQLRLILISLNECEHEIFLKTEKNMCQLEEQKDSLKSLIPEVEEKCQQPPIQMLKDVKTTLSRWENMEIPKEQPDVPELKTCYQPDFPRQYFVLWKMSEIFKDKLSGKLGKIAQEIEWRKYRCFAVSINLDPESANPLLTVSKDGKNLKRGDSPQKVADNPKRFVAASVAVGCQGFSSGKYYWEVDVEDSVEWSVGVCNDTVERVEILKESPDNGFWIIGCRNGQNLIVSGSAFYKLKPKVMPKIVGVYLDYDAGKLSFCNVTDKTHLHTFASKFTNILRPYFCIGKPFGDLTICPSKEWE